jgi:hypothetical protein
MDGHDATDHLDHDYPVPRHSHGVSGNDDLRLVLELGTLGYSFLFILLLNLFLRSSRMTIPYRFIVFRIRIRDSDCLFPARYVKVIDWPACVLVCLSVDITSIGIGVEGYRALGVVV